MLEPIDGTELSEYSIRLLKKRRIHTVEEFVSSEYKLLTQILHIDEEKIFYIKQELVKRFGITSISLTKRNSNLLRYYKIYKTGIEVLDELLQKYNNVFSSGCIWEVCGRVGVGKSELLRTLALNFVSNHNNSVLFIDTKQDFSGRRIKEMLRNRTIDKKICGHVMQSIKVCCITTIKDIIDVLDEFLKNLQNSNEYITTIRIIFIDSISAPWLHFRSDKERKESQYLLTELAAIIRKLATYYLISFVICNLSISVDQLDEDAAQQAFGDDDINLYADSEFQPCNENSYDRPMCGQYWSTVTSLSLSLEKISTSSEADVYDDSYRVLKILKSATSATNASCIVRLTKDGVC